MFKSFASLAVAAIAADTDPVTPESPVTTGILKYIAANAVTASTTATPPVETMMGSISNQITYAGSTVVNQTNSYISSSVALATGGAWTGFPGETAQTATCYMDGTKYMCTVSSYMISTVTDSSTGAISAGPAVYSVTMSLAKQTKPTFVASSALSS